MCFVFFFFNDTATTEIYTLSLHDALPICPPSTVKDTCFFEWLKEQGCEDTVVFELDRMAGYWTAINLFLEKSDGPTAEQIGRAHV